MARPMAREGASRNRERTAPAPDSGQKPESPPDLAKPSWAYTAKKSFAEFGRDQCTDLAAALTYYAVLALFPALLALISLLGIFGQGESTTNAMLDMIRQIGQGNAADQLRGPISQMTQTHSAGFALVFGILGALWSASGYVGAFGRAMNRIYQMDEGRPFWKLRPLQLLHHAGRGHPRRGRAGRPGRQRTDRLVRRRRDRRRQHRRRPSGASRSGRSSWPSSCSSWSLLYYATPNVKQPKFRWVSIGAGIAILVWVLASVLFGFYVSHFGSYNKTYGSLAGVIVFLLWLWLTNLALLFGAEVDAELERSRAAAGRHRGRGDSAAPASRRPGLAQAGAQAAGARAGGPGAARAGPGRHSRLSRPRRTRPGSVVYDAPREPVCRVARPRFGRSPGPLAHWSGCLTRAIDPCRRRHPRCHTSNRTPTCGATLRKRKPRLCRTTDSVRSAWKRMSYGREAGATRPTSGVGWPGNR